MPASAPETIDAVAVTNAPGLVGALLVGVSFAKAFAFARGIPVRRRASHGRTPVRDGARASRRGAAVHRAARLRRSHAARRRRGVGRVPPARPHARRRRRRGVRQGGQAARPSLSRRPARRATRARRAIRRASASRGRCCAATSGPAIADYYDVSFSGLKTAVLNAVRAGIAGRPSAHRARLSRRASSTRSSRRRRAP